MISLIQYLGHIFLVQHVGVVIEFKTFDLRYMSIIVELCYSWHI